MTDFDTLYTHHSRQGASSALLPLIAELHTVAIRVPINLHAVHAATIAILEFLVIPKNRTDANCVTVDSVLMYDDALWDRLEALEDSHSKLNSVIADMAGALHDTVSAPEIAANVESTPEQLLERARNVFV
ncbi:MAG: hypothetical protein GY861_01370 [bacterium]|nr:hypothetical protein [bacterium]